MAQSTVSRQFNMDPAAAGHCTMPRDPTAGAAQREALDTAEPPKIVIQQPAQCTDAGRADDVLRRTLAPARAPSGAWTVTLRVTPAPGGALRGEGEVTDAAGAPVAHRDFIDAAPDCAPLARAVGVWASLVLDQELARVRSAVTPLVASTLPAAPPLPRDDAVPEVSVWPAPIANEKPRPEASLILQHEDGKRTIETGGHIKSIGSHPVSVKLHPGVTANVALVVKAG